MKKPGDGMQMFHEQVHDRVKWQVAVEERKALVREIKSRGIKLKNPHEMRIADLRRIAKGRKK